MTRNPATYDIPEFCYQHKISRSLFYKLKRLNLAPRLMKVGKRILISEEAAKAWRQQMEETKEDIK